MYITGKYWDGYIGGSDDSLTLVDYLAGKQVEELSLQEIFSDFGLDKCGGDFRSPEEFIVFQDDQGWEMEIHYAIDMLTSLAALLLECKVSGGVDLGELAGHVESRMLRLTAAPEEHELMHRVLADFAADPLAYDLSEMVPEEDMREMAALCRELCEELYR